MLKLWRLDIVLLALFVFACYGVRIDYLSIRGEESRWATVAMEMRRSGDWVVPRQQGEPFLSRPPMGSWLIALAALARGAVDPIAVRMPSVLAVLATTLLIYGYGRSFLGRPAALAASTGFAAMPEILQMGRLAESDAVFTFFLGGSLVVWHWGHSRGWPAALTWSASYLLVAGGTLTKGPQAPLYFASTVGIYLISIGQWRRLLTPPHLLGIGIYALALGSWLVPFAAELGPAKAWAILTGDSTDRFVNLSLGAIALHMLIYPLELLGCTAPWSWLLVAFASRRFRRGLADAGPHARFLAIALAVSFPTCWITPGGQTRYLMPLYPCVALLAGIVIDRIAIPSLRLRLAMMGVRNLTALTMLGFASAVVWMTWFADDPELRCWKQRAWFAIAFSACSALGMALLTIGWPGLSLRSPGLGAATGASKTQPRPPMSLLAAAVCIAAFYAGAVVNQLSAMSEHVAEAMVELPHDVHLASLGPVHHKFAYEYGESIELLDEHATPAGCFCYTSVGGKRQKFDFACEEVAAISMDRHHYVPPQVEVIVLRRVESDHSRQVAQRQP